VRRVRDEKLTAFVELESAIRADSRWLQRLVTLARPEENGPVGYRWTTASAHKAGRYKEQNRH
jgi:hypothetical protein